jgi:dihydropteroate synthase
LFTLSCNDKTLTLKTPIVMGILNATPNSFYNKGQESDLDSLLRIADKMLNDGAAILDIGGASTKPGEPLIDVARELTRVIPAIQAIRSRFPETWLSVDTYNAPVAKAALEAGADIVNDISAGTFDKDMLRTVASQNAPFIAMHIQGTPENMQIAPKYDNVVAEVKINLQEAIRNCEEAGIKQIIIDPGFGFGKTVEHNFELLHFLSKFKTLGKPILAGLSRKSLICKPLKINPEHALNGTTALNMAALINGADILRVHDVKEAIEVVRLFSLLKG